MELLQLSDTAETCEASSICERSVFCGLGADSFLFFKKGAVRKQYAFGELYVFPEVLEWQWLTRKTIQVWIRVNA